MRWLTGHCCLLCLAAHSQEYVFSNDFETPVNHVTVEPEARLLSGAGDASLLSGQVVDPDGNPIEGPLNWSSSIPSAVSVDPWGTITAQADMGSAVITVGSPGAWSATVPVTVAGAVPGATVLDPDDLIEGPAYFAGPADGELFGEQSRLVLAPEIPPPGVGDAVLVTNWSAKGRVISVNELVSGTEVVVATAPSAELFSDHDLDFSAPIISGAIEPETPAEKVFDTGVPVGPFKCKLKDISTVLPDLSTNLEPDPDYSQLRYAFISELENYVGLASEFIVVEGPVKVPLNGFIEVGESDSTRVECKLKLKEFKHKIGPATLKIPLSVGFDLNRLIESPLLRVNLSGYITLNVKIGIRYTLQNGLEKVESFDIDDSGLNVEPELSELGESRLALELSQFFSAQTKVGFGDGFLSVYLSFAEFKAGHKLTIDAAGVLRQVRDSAYAGFGQLSGFYSYGPKEGTIVYWKAFLNGVLNVPLTVLDFAGVDLEALLTFKDDIELYRTPTGILAASPLAASVGEPVSFALELSNATFEGFYQPEKIEIYRLDGEGPETTAELFHEITPAEGQALFEWEWAPTQQDKNTVVRLLPFVYSRLLPGIPLKMDSVETTVSVETSLFILGGRVKVNGKADAHEDYSGERDEEEFEFDQVASSGSFSIQAGAGGNASIAGEVVIELQFGEFTQPIAYSGSSKANGGASATAAVDTGGTELLIETYVDASASAQVGVSCHTLPDGDMECTDPSADSNATSRASVTFQVSDIGQVGYELAVSGNSSSNALCGGSQETRTCLQGNLETICVSQTGQLAPGNYRLEVRAHPDAHVDDDCPNGSSNTSANASLRVFTF